MAEGKIFDAVTGVEHQSKSSLGNDCADARLLFCLSVFTLSKKSQKYSKFLKQFWQYL